MKWVVVLLGVFQTRFCLTDNALAWLLRYLSVFLKALANLFSNTIADVAKQLPKSLYKHDKATANLSLGSDSFEKRVVCESCSAIYNYDECVSKQGPKVSVSRCTYKPFRGGRQCGKLLMKEIVWNSFHIYPSYTSAYPKVENVDLVDLHCSKNFERKMRFCNLETRDVKQ